MAISKHFFRNQFCLVFAGLVFFGDQAGKRFIDQPTLPMLERHPILGSHILNYSRVHNYGLIGDRYSALPAGSIQNYTLYLPSVCLALLMGVVAARWRNGIARDRWGGALLFWLFRLSCG